VAWWCLGSPQVCAKFSDGQGFSDMCFVFFALLVFVFVSFVPNVSSFSGFSVLDCHFGFR
jgi:hypothetical protein